MLERSLLRKDQHAQMDSVMREYLDLGHAEQVPVEDLKEPPNEIFYFSYSCCLQDLKYNNQSKGCV